MNFKKALFVASLLDYDQRRRNYEEFRERVESNIDRWEGHIERLEGDLQRVLANNRKNRESLYKTKLFLESLGSEKTREWISRQIKISESHHSPEKQHEAYQRITNHRDKIESAEAQIERIDRWLIEGEEREASIRNRISEMERKISDARCKL